MTKENWYDELPACKGMHDIFDFENPSQGDAGNVPFLRRICGGCPVREECLADALHHSDEYTFRAGLTPIERVRLMMKLGIPTWEEKQTMKRREAVRPVKHGISSEAWSKGCSCRDCSWKSNGELERGRRRK